MKTVAEQVLAQLKKSEGEIRRQLRRLGAVPSVLENSVHKLGNNACVMLLEDRRILVVADYERVMPDGFEGESLKLCDGGVALLGEWNLANAAVLRRLWPWCSPGFGRERGAMALVDPGELAGWLRAARTHLVSPAGYRRCDSAAACRELAAETTFQVFAADDRNGCPAIAVVPEAETALGSGISAVLLDASPDLKVWSQPASEIDPAFGALTAELRERIDTEYSGCCYVLDSQEAVSFDDGIARRCAVAFAPVFAQAVKVAGYSGRGRAPILPGLRLPELPAEQLVPALLFCVRELRRRNVDFFAVAPKRQGEGNTVRTLEKVAALFAPCHLIASALPAESRPEQWALELKSWSSLEESVRTRWFPRRKSESIKG